MLFLKKLKLVNFCNFENYEISFIKPNGEPYKYVCFFGPNGVGKSTLLESVSMLPGDIFGRTSQFVSQGLQKYVRHPDYDPTWQKVTDETEREMFIEGIYDIDGKEYIVQINQNGWVRNDLCPIAIINENDDDDAEQKSMRSGPWKSDHLLYRKRISYFIKSDSDLSMSKFQLHWSQKDDFEKIVSQITRFPCECLPPKGLTPQEREFSTDFVIIKKNYRIHFKRMSAGERKICKSFSDIFNLMHSLKYPKVGDPVMDKWPRLLLIDNVEMHVYYDRHVQMVECLKEIFQHQQIFATTHSGILINRFLRGENDRENELMINLEEVNN
jgi:energy-coupling factor transporter ATP-binding protein EcfA2